MTFPRGVADPDRGIGYVANPSGGIDAVDLGVGDTLWTTQTAWRPILARHDRLVAQVRPHDRKNAFQVAVLDPNHGGRLVRMSDPVLLPEWVSVTEDDDFGFSAHAEGDELVIDWQAHARYRGGANPPPHVLAAATKDAAGRATIDLATGAARSSLAPAASAEAESGPADARSPSAARLTLEPQARNACVIGPRVYYLVDEPSGTMLKAREAGSGQLLWERRLSPRPPSSRRALRP